MPMAIAADRQLWHESERRLEPSKQRGKEGQAGATESVHHFSTRPSLLTSAEVYFNVLTVSSTTW